MSYIAQLIDCSYHVLRCVEDLSEKALFLPLFQVRGACMLGRASSAGNISSAIWRST